MSIRKNLRILFSSSLLITLLIHQNLQAYPLNRKDACESLLKSLPRPTYIENVDKAQTLKALTAFRNFKQSRLIHVPNYPILDFSRNPTLLVVRPNSTPRRLQEARQLVTDLELSELNFHILAESIVGRVLTETGEINNFSLGLGRRLERRSHLERQHYLRDLAISGGIGISGLAMSLAESLYSGRGLGWMGSTIISLAVVKAFWLDHDHRDYFSELQTVLQRMILAPDPEEWIYVHSRSKGMEFDLLAYTPLDGGIERPRVQLISLLRKPLPQSQ